MKRLLPLLLALTACTPAGPTSSRLFPGPISAATSSGTLSPDTSSGPLSPGASPGSLPLGPSPARNTGGTDPLPTVRTNALVALGAAAPLAGTVQLDLLPPFPDTAAPFALLSTPAPHALITVTTLEGDRYASNGVTITGATDASGHFQLLGAVPADRPCVVVARLAGNHQLSALVPPGTTSVTVNEASSLVVELARWQLRPSQDPNAADVTDLQDLPTLTSRTAAAVSAADLTPDDLTTGAGFALRNAYVAALGTRPEAAALSDQWEAALGFHPLAATIAAGNQLHGIGPIDGQPAGITALQAPQDALTDASGNLYMIDGGALRFSPKADMAGPLFGAAGPLQAGRIYTLAPADAEPASYAARFAAATDAAGGPPLTPASRFPVPAPRHLMLEPASGGRSHLTFTAPDDGRVFMLPADPLTRYGRSLTTGHLYALTPPLGRPTAIARDAAGNLFILADGLVVLRAGDGKLSGLPLTLNGNVLNLTGAQDLALSPDGSWLYVAATAQHAVFRLPLPNPQALPASAEVTRVLGNPGQAGAPHPDVYQLAAAVTESPKVLLDSPSALTFTKAGDLLVADANRLRLLSGSQVATIAGGLATSYVTGDARLAAWPRTAALHWCSFDNNVLVTDQNRDLIRRLWTSAGVLHKGR